MKYLFRSCVMIALISGVVVFLSAAVILVSMIVSGHSETKYYSIPSEFVKMDYYTGDKDTYLGRKGHEDSDRIGGVYTLKGLSRQDYLYYEQYSVLSPNGAPNQHIYMNKNIVEPILQYSVDKIGITSLNEGTVYIDDKQIINDLLLLRKEKYTAKGEPVSMTKMNTTFYLDLPCNLKWNCYIDFREDDTICLTCFDIADNCWYDYDVTTILLPLLQNLE